MPKCIDELPTKNKEKMIIEEQDGKKNLVFYWIIYIQNVINIYNRKKNEKRKKSIYLLYNNSSILF